MTTEVRRVTYPNAAYSGYTRSLSERGGGKDCDDCEGHGGCPECRSRTLASIEPSASALAMGRSMGLSDDAIFRSWIELKLEGKL